MEAEALSHSRPGSFMSERRLLTPAELRRQAEIASRAVALLDEVVALGRELPLGREAGERLWRRIDASRASFGRIAERDRNIAKDLASYLQGELDWAAAVRTGTQLRKRRQPRRSTS
jgi:hypothetical protein